MAFKRIEKDFVLSDSSVNVYGFRLLTSGYQLGEFEKNPIGYYDHKKADGVLLRWEDVRVEGDQVLGKPVINLEHPRGERTVEEVENGFLNSASVGKLVVLEYLMEDNPEDPEHPIMVATKWYNKECSLVDNPGNRNAMKVELYDAQDNEINLSDLTTDFKMRLNTSKHMRTINLTPALLASLNLSDDAKQEAVEQAVASQKTENETLTADKAKLEQDLSDERKSAVTKKVTDILNKYQKIKGLTQAEVKDLADDYANEPEKLEKRLANRPNYVALTDKIAGASAASGVKDLADKSWDEIDAAGEQAALRADPELFKSKYKQRFGVEPKI